MINRVHKRLVSILVCLFLTSCTSAQFSDLFSGYAQQMRQVHIAQNKGDYLQAQALIPTRSPSDGTYTLSLLEKARLQFLAKEWQASQNTLTEVNARIQSEKQKSKIQLSRGAEKVGAVVSNDSALRYDVPLYEQSMMYSYQALNYLYQHQLEDALVEIRRANLVQEQALKENEQVVFKAQKKMSEQGVSVNSLDERYPSMDNIIGDIKNGFQNAYTFYLSGLLYEASGEYNDAYIDYKKALEIYPQNSYLKQDVLRLADQLGMDYGDEKLAKALNNYQKAPKTNGEIVVIYEQGIIEPKQEISLNLPLFTYNGNMRFFSFALPIYRNNYIQKNELLLTYKGQQYFSQEIVRLQSLAAKSLKDNMPGLVTRQIVRVLAKEQMRQQASRSAGDLGNLFATLYNVASEKADTRSWMTLPNTVQVLRLSLPEGNQQVAVNVMGNQQDIDIVVKKNKINLLYVTSTGSYVTYHNINL